MGGHFPLVDRSFHPSFPLGQHLFDETLSHAHDYDQQQQHQQQQHHHQQQQQQQQHQQQQHRSMMMMMNGTANLPQWSMPQINLTSSPMVK